VRVLCSGLSFLVFIINFVWSLYINPTPSPSNPWDSLGLEWQTATPIPWHNFERIPVVMSDPYHYSEADAPPLADFGEKAPAPATSSTTAGPSAWSSDE
jgi:cytochrome aa3-600 menaquinol oxidase subunit I